MNGKDKKLISISVVLAAVVVALIVLIFQVKTTFENIKQQFSEKKAETVFVPRKTQDKIILQSDGTIKEVSIATGAVQDANNVEKEDYSDFQGLPKFSSKNGQTTQLDKSLLSLDGTQTLLTVGNYENGKKGDAGPNNGDGTMVQKLIASSNFLCDIAQKTCQKTNVFSQTYQNLDSALQQANSPLVWFAWDSAQKTLYGHLTLNDLGDSSPVYVCDTQKQNCQVTKSFDSLQNPDAHAVVPTGAFSPSLDKFVMILQHDKPNEETGKNWQLLLYNSDDLAKPSQVYDLTNIIDHDEAVAYDGVQSVSWSGDEKTLAIGTSRKIFLLNLNTTAVSLAHTMATNANGDYYWDSSSLYLTPDARFISFIDSPSLANDNQDNSSSSDAVSILEKIDLSSNNVNVTKSMFSGKDMEVKF